MRFACYQGTGTISGLIRRFTRSRYSHVALQFNDFVFEAVGSGIVRAGSLLTNHDMGTVVDLFDYERSLMQIEEIEARRFCEHLVGKPYDYESVLKGFPLRLAGDTDRKAWFCSELAQAVGMFIGRPLQHMMPWRCQPDHVAISLALKWKGSITL